MKSDVILVGDWSKHRDKRAVCKAYPAFCRIESQPPPPGGEWSLEGLLERARIEQERWHGAVLVALDVGLGIPEGLLERSPWPAAKTFPEWLLLASAEPGFFAEVQDAALWKPTQPFFRVLPGQGSYRRFRDHLPLLRKIDCCTGGKPLFMVSGIPGTVGSATREIWRELVRLLPVKDRRFTLWPFEGGDLQELLADRRIVVAETYPRAAYATALRPLDPRPAQLVVPKTRQEARDAALDQLGRTGWWTELRVDIQLQHLREAAESEDPFDALLTAAALLRCFAMSLPLFCPKHCDAIEGAILGTGTVNLELRPQAFRYGFRTS